MSRSPSTLTADASNDDYLAGWMATHDLLRKGRSWSGHERNCAFLNCGSGSPAFASVSGISGLDFLDDGRGLALVDWDHDGDLDMWLFNRSGPRLRLMRNDFDTEHGFIAFRLQGTTTNRDAIGARLEIQLASPMKRKLIQTVHAGDAFISQSSKWLHFGLGPKADIQHISIRWPGGKTEKLTGFQPGMRYKIVEGQGKPITWEPPSRTIRLEPSDQPSLKTTDAARVVLPNRLPMPYLPYRSYADRTEQAVQTQQRPLLINFWRTDCNPCSVELQDLTERADTLRAAGLNVLALSLDGLGSADTTGPDDAQQRLAEIAFPFDAGMATPECLDKFELIDGYLFDRQSPLLIPASYLLDRTGQLAVLYRGQVDLQQLLRDVENLQASPDEIRLQAAPFPGRFLGASAAIDLPRWAGLFEDRYQQDYMRFLELAINHEVLERPHDPTNPSEMKIGEIEMTLRLALADARRNNGELSEAARQYKQIFEVNPDEPSARILLGLTFASQEKWDEAIDHYKFVLRRVADDAMVHFHLARALTARDQRDEAMYHFRQAVELEPEYGPAHYNLANLLGAEGSFDLAIQHYRECLSINSNHAQALYRLGVLLHSHATVAEALPHLREAARLLPESPTILNALAWTLATDPDERNRDPSQALRVAQRVVELDESPIPAHLDTLAAAYASAGQFDRAVAAAEEALQWIETSVENGQADRIRRRLELYRKRQPYFVSGK